MVGDRREHPVRSRGDRAVVTSWGEVSWLVGNGEPHAELTLGVVTVRPGRRNPLHRHPNCEELLYVVSGECEHRLGDDLFPLVAGSVIRVPRGVPHCVSCTGDEPLVAVVAFSSPDRETENLEGGELA